MPSSHTTTVTKKAWRWRRSRCYMVKDAYLIYCRMGLENDMFLDQKLYKTQRSKYVLWERIWRLPNHAKRVTHVVGEEIWALKLKILYTSRCHLWKAFVDSKLEEILHQDLLNHSRSWNKKEKWPINWNCPRSFLLYTMYSMCHSWRNVCEYLRNKPHWKIWL
jgi:hypothetical protein